METGNNPEPRVSGRFDFFAAMRAKQAVGRHVAFALMANHGFILVTGDILAPFNFDRRQMTAFEAITALKRAIITCGSLVGTRSGNH